MNKINLKEIEAGMNYTGCLMAIGVVEKTAKNGSTYVEVTFSDGATTTNAKVWKTSVDEANTWLKKVLSVKLEVQLYNGNISCIASNVQLVNESEVNLGDFIIKAPLDGEDMYDEIIQMLQSCKVDIKQVAINLYESNKNKLLYWSAARAMHHNMYGGLLYHTLRMMKNAENICKTYTTLNRDMLLIGCALHDIGKTVELETDDLGVAEYTIDGNLFGHLLIGVQLVAGEVAKGKYSNSEVRQIYHMIASHHGKKEYGAIAVPCTMEAKALHFIDDMDAKFMVFENAYSELNPGEQSQSSTKMLEDARIYRPL